MGHSLAKGASRIVPCKISILFNSLSNDKFLDWSELKAIVNDKIDVFKQKFSFKWVESIAVKDENAGFMHFLFFPQCFEKASFQNR